MTRTTTKQGKTTRQLKDEKFAETLVKNGFNGSKTVKQLMNPKDNNQASSMAVEKMKQRGIQKALGELLDEAEMSKERRAELMARNAEQIKNLSASNTSLDMMNKIDGDYAPTKSMSINATLTPDERKQELERLHQEYKELTEIAPNK